MNLIDNSYMAFMREVDCPICTEEVKMVHVVACLYPKCKFKVCFNCVKSQVNITLGNGGGFVKCLATECNGHILRSQIELLPFDKEQKEEKEELLKLYDTCMIKALTKAHGETASKAIEQTLMLKKIRDERQVFIETNFPKAIALVAVIALKDKLNNLEKRKKELKKSLNDGQTKNCFNYACKGHLDKDMVCLLCNTKFCFKCEKKIKKGEDHICNKDDVDSLEIIRSMSHCPNCKLPIQKSQGCDHMHCKNCDMHFNYATGQEMSSSENKDQRQFKTFVPFSQAHSKDLNEEEKDIIAELENLQNMVNFEKTETKLIKKLQNLFLKDDKKEEEDKKRKKKRKREKRKKKRKKRKK